MKKNLFFQHLMFACVILLNVSSYAQINEDDGDEVVLLGKLKMFMRVANVNDLYDVQKINSMLVKIESPIVVQFFLDNITWDFTKGDSVNLTFQKSVHGYTYGSPFGSALMKCKDVPLRQCMDALARSKEGTLRAYMLEVVARHIHGDDFLREVETLAETSPGAERWEGVKKRFEQNIVIMRPQWGGDSFVEEDPVEDDVPETQIDNETPPHSINNPPAMTSGTSEVTPPPVVARGAGQTRLWLGVGAVLVCGLGAAVYLVLKKP